MSDGVRYEGFIFTNPKGDKDLRIYDLDKVKYRDFPLAKIDKICVSVEPPGGEWVERVWRWKEGGSDVKVFDDRWYIAHEDVTYFYLSSGEKILGSFRGPIYILTPFELHREIFHARHDGEVVTSKKKLKPPVHIKELAFEPELFTAIAEGLKRPPERPPGASKARPPAPPVPKQAESTREMAVLTSSLERAMGLLYNLRFKEGEKQGTALCRAAAGPISQVRLIGERELAEAHFTATIHKTDSRKELRYNELILQGFCELVAVEAQAWVRQTFKPASTNPFVPISAEGKIGEFKFKLSSDASAEDGIAHLRVEVTRAEK